MFFDGTVELTSTDHEDAHFVSEVMAAAMRRIGQLAFVQVVTDTCSVMQAAWRNLRTHFPWLTTTCCGTHVLALELKDLAKIPAVAAVIAKVQVVLSLFWGRKRWPRRRLRETIAANHGGKEFGLYRAKQTRFAGKFREMSRMLRCKADLQQVVVSSDYAKQKFTQRGTSADGDDQLDPAIGTKVKAIVLDEDGFWRPMTEILYIAMPLIKLLRLLDGNKPAIGKIYDRMFTIGQRLQQMSNTISWAPAMSKIHSERWEYLHSPFHAAAYALDPEFLATVGELDEACQDGVLLVIERMCLRDVIALAPDVDHAILTITSDSPQVVQRVAQAEGEFAKYQRREGPFSRPAVLLNAKKMEPAAWWSTYGRHLPLLATIASRVLAQPGAASWAERNWSIYGQIKSANKSRMQHRTADKLVYCHETLYLQNKLQSAGWQPDVVAHETDEESASEASDEEKDLTDEIFSPDTLALLMQ
jgi:hypothetical protein